MRLIVSYSAENDDLFVQGEWTDNGGFHTRRLTEDMPLDVKTKMQEVVDWCNRMEKTIYIPDAETSARRSRIEQEIGKLQQTLKTL